MKVLLINNDKGWSGGQEHLKDLSSQLSALGVSVHFGVREGSRSDVRFRELGFPVHALPKHGLGDLVAFGRLVSLLRRERFDIVSVNREHDLFLCALAWHVAFPIKKCGKFMMSYHTATSRPQLLLGTADAVVCISEHVKNKLMLKNGGVAPKLKIIYYGIAVGSAPPPEKFSRDRRRRFFQDVGFPLIGMVGELWKNQIELISMMPLMRRRFPDLTLALVGDNTDKNLLDPLLASIEELDLKDSVIFTGRIPRERIPDVFFDLDLSVTTHRNEGFGIVHLESLAAGTPLVACNEGGFVDIFWGEDVGTVVGGGQEEFSDAVTDLLQDDERRFRFGANGHELVKRKYSLEAMGKSYLEFYRSLLAEP